MFGSPDLEDPQTVTLKKPAQDFTITNCYKAASSEEQFEDDPGMTYTTTKFTLWVTYLQGQVVVKGDKIAHAGTTYTVRKSELLVRGTKYRATCTEDTPLA